MPNLVHRQDKNTTNYELLTTNSKSKGFTLVELLVTVAIIAILSLVGITIYTSTLKNARDAKRVSDIDSIAKALEVNKKGSTYTKLSSAYFSSGKLPVDETTTKYCIQGNSTDTTLPIDPDAWTSSQACPGSYIEIAVTDGLMTFSSAYKSWKICARLESSTDSSPIVYCRGSSL